MTEDIKILAEKAIAERVYAKEITYMFPDGDAKEFYKTKLLAGSPGQSAWMITQVYRKKGVQLQVSKQVSDDLLATDFASAAKIENIPFPAPCIEVFFEDPFLPTVLVMRIRPEQIEKWFPFLELHLPAEEYITTLLQEGYREEAKALSLQLKPEMYDAFLGRAETPHMDTAILSSDLNDRDHAIQCYMLHLALKVLVFASIPVYKPTPIFRKQMRYGGKPGMKGRPNRPSSRVSYLPKVIYPAKDQPIASSRDFKGRRGHIHWYRHQRFIIRQGTWDFFPPVVDPHTGKYPERKVIKVRKV